MPMSHFNAWMREKLCKGQGWPLHSGDVHIGDLLEESA
ncbi:hypothetical protein PPIS_b0296 [Pseudoalteromonas piscicida]|uniref:Uncharacterized protein n=1 Tax=Pseudoalteromonas piscicida TaxID=43662 RepID=A0ABM6NKL4_PSEO7|nr:hypothetical protein PPIS_b0296 [Pseudoalteromonas piscicida]